MPPVCCHNQENTMSDRKPSFGLPAVILSLGLLAAAFVLGYQFKNLR